MLDAIEIYPAIRKCPVNIQQQDSPPVELYPLKPGYREERNASADLAASRINFVSYLSKELVKALTQPFVDPSVKFPGNDTIYVMRGIGPAYVPPEDFNFVTQNYNEVYIRVVAINLYAAAVDLMSAAIDSGKLDKALGDAKLLAKVIDEAVKLAPTIHSGEDFAVAASKLAAFFLKEYINNEIKDGIKTLSGAAANPVAGCD